MTGNATRALVVASSALTAGASIAAAIAAVGGATGLAIAAISVTQLGSVVLLVGFLRRQSRALATHGHLLERLRRGSPELRRLAESSEEHSSDLDETRRHLRWAIDKASENTRFLVARDTSALAALHFEYARGADLAGYSPWAATPETMLMLASAIRSLPDDALVLEFGGGVSTAWLALANSRRTVPVRIISVEHDPDWAAETRAILDRVSATGIELRVAPLTHLELPGWSGVWYDTRELDDIDTVDLVFVDGPPGTTTPLARYPALPVIHSRLGRGSLVILDDYARGDEAIVRDRWVAEFDLHVHRTTDRAVMLQTPLL